MVPSIACHKSPAAPAPTPENPDRSLPVRVESAHYTFHLSQGDRVDPNHQEVWHEWAVVQLALAPDRKVQYYKYRDRAQMLQVTGKDANGWADPAAFAIHIISPWDSHEVVHVLTALIGRPSDFFNEGIAVAMSVDPSADQFIPQWLAQSVHAWTRQFRTAGQLPRLLDIVETDSFRKLSDTSSYPTAGSFMAFMIDTHGMDAVRRFFSGASRDESRPAIERRFAETFGMSLTAAEDAWHAFLDSGADRP
jgi:hypothetical protein